MNRPRVHVSKVQLRLKDLRSTVPTQIGLRPRTGLWYAFGREWVDWCEANEFKTPTDHWHEVIVREDHLLRVHPREVERRYGRDHDQVPLFLGLDWPTIARDWAGIEFPWYDWNLRYELASTWYYALDCASGVIWDVAAIIDIREIEPLVKEIT